MLYELIEGRYVLQEQGRLHPPLHEVAIGYMSPKDTANLAWRSQRHGDPEVVNAWAKNARQALSKTGALGKAMASEIHVISGSLDLEDLNAVLRDPTAILALVRHAANAPKKSSPHTVKVDGRPINQEDTNG